jgi:hypothetical protein
VNGKSFLNPAVIPMVDQAKAASEAQSLSALNGGTPTFEEQTPVWVWDGYWWPAYVVVPALDLGSDLMLVRFENGVTAPVKASDVRHRDSESTHINQLAKTCDIVEGREATASSWGTATSGAIRTFT